MRKFQTFCLFLWISSLNSGTIFVALLYHIALCASLAIVTKLKKHIRFQLVQNVSCLLKIFLSIKLIADLIYATGQLITLFSYDGSLFTGLEWYLFPCLSHTDSCLIYSHWGLILQRLAFVNWCIPHASQFPHYMHYQQTYSGRNPFPYCMHNQLPIKQGRQVLHLWGPISITFNAFTVSLVTSVQPYTTLTLYQCFLTSFITIFLPRFLALPLVTLVLRLLKNCSLTESAKWFKNLKGDQLSV